MASFSCVYTAFLALNGTTEAFVYGIARSGNDVGKIGIAHAVIGGIFALVAPTLVKREGAVGLVAANCIAMALRSLYSLHYAHGYFRKAGCKISIMNMVSRIMPHIMVVIMFLVSFIITRISRIHLYDAKVAAGGSWITHGAQHILVGVLCVAVSGAFSLWLEKDIRSAILRMAKRKKD